MLNQIAPLASAQKAATEDAVDLLSRRDLSRLITHTLPLERFGDVRALVEGPGQARSEDFTEVAFAGHAPTGTVITGKVAGHDGRHGRLDEWRAC